MQTMRLVIKLQYVLLNLTIILPNIAFGLNHLYSILCARLVIVLFLISNLVVYIASNNNTIDSISVLIRKISRDFLALVLFWFCCYSFFSILNSLYIFDDEIKVFTNTGKVFEFLPASLDPNKTCQHLTNYIFLLVLCIALNIYFINKKGNNKEESFKILIRSLSLCIIINGFFHILTRFGWFCNFVESTLLIKIDSKNNLGTFLYRGNGCAFLLGCLPLLLQKYSFIKPEKKQTNTLVVFLLLLLIVISDSRAGIILLITNLVFFVLLRNELKLNCLVPYLILTIMLALIFNQNRSTSRFSVNNKFINITNGKSCVSDLLNFQCKLISGRGNFNYKQIILFQEENRGIITKEFIVAVNSDGDLLLRIIQNKNVVLENIYNNIIMPDQINLIRISRTNDLIKLNVNNKYINPESATNKVPDSQFLLCWNRAKTPNAIYDKKHEKILMISNLGYYHEKYGKYSKIYDYKLTVLNKLRALLSNRIILYQTAGIILKDHFMTGIGLGAWPSVYSLFKDPGNPLEAWIHCDPLEFLLSFGIVGLSIPVFILVLSLIDIKRKKIRFDQLQKACIYGLLNLVIYSFVDFPFQNFGLLIMSVYLLKFQSHCFLNKPAK